MGPYPASAAQWSNVGGTLVVQSVEGKLKIYGVVTGLSAGSTGEWHVHEGASCTSATGEIGGDVLLPHPGGHYIPEGGDHPWANPSPTYTTDSNGVAVVELSIGGFSLVDENPVVGLVLVLHATDDTDQVVRVGCGIIAPTPAQVALVGAFPGNPGRQNPYM